MKHIIVLVGEIGSGKGTVADHIVAHYNASYHRFSSMLRDVARRLYLPESRDVLISVSEIVRSKFGEGTLANVMAKDVEYDDHELIIVDGARRMADVEYLSKLEGYHLIYVTTTIETRYERVKNRGEKVDEKNMSFEQFKKDNERSTEVSIHEVASYAEKTINNDGTLEQLHAQVEALLTEYGLPKTK